MHHTDSPIILIVDDNPVNLDILFQRLQRTGFKVLITENGMDAIQQAIRIHPDLILLDIMMPGLDGFETCQRLKANTSTSDIPIIFMTASSHPDNIVRAFEVGAVDYVVKPLEWREVVARIETQMTVRDLQKQLRHENKRLRESEERYALAAQGSNDGLWDWDMRQRRMYFSPRWKQVLGFEEADLPNRMRSWLGLVHPDDLPPLQARLAEHFQRKTPHFQAEYRILHKDGTYRWMLGRGLAVYDEHGQPYRFAGSQTDITTQKYVEEKLRHESTHDTLTGLPNRTLFLDELETLMQYAHTTNDYSFAVLFVDLDRFKLINDSLGHAAGDALLCEVACRLHKCLTPGDSVARFAGDEFVILQHTNGDATQTVNLAETIQQMLIEPIYLNTHTITMTASVGIAAVDATYLTADELLRDADTAMYQAKSQGRAKYCLFTKTVPSHAITELQLKTSLREAFKSQEFQIYYQPVVSLKTGHIIGAEALLRWQHPQFGLLTADQFLHLVDTSDLTLKLDRWVLHMACTQAKQWLDAGATSFRLWVNLSLMQTLQTELVPIIQNTLAEVGLPPQTLHLELTEQLIDRHDIEINLDTLAAVKALGVHLSIDDFSLRSSLSILKEDLLHIVKLDRSLVNEAPHNPMVAHIVAAVIKLVHNLGLEVIAEGVETPAELTFLRQQHCDAVQGFLFSPAVPAMTLTHLLQNEVALC